MRTTLLVACLAVLGLAFGQADVWAQGKGGGRGGDRGRSDGGQRSAPAARAPSAPSAAPSRAAPMRAAPDAGARVGGAAQGDADARIRTGDAKAEGSARTRVDANAGTRVETARPRVDVDTGTRVDAGKRTQLDSGTRLSSDAKIVTPTRVQVGSGFRDGIRFWNGSSWVWGFGPRYGYWDGFGWGFGPWDRYGAFWGPYRPGFGYWDDFYAGPYYYGPSYVQPAIQSRTALGITMDERDNAVFVRSVVPGSPAEQAGLRRGDMIVAVDGTLVTSADQVAGIVARHQPGDELKIETDRNGREMRTAAVLEEHTRVF